MHGKNAIISLIFFSLLLTVSGQTNRQPTLKDTITDTSIQVPQELEYNLEQMLVDWKNCYRQSNACNQFANADITFPDSVYIHRLYSFPTEMELAYNGIVRSYIDLYTSRRRTSVQYMLASGEYYFPIIEETLDKYGLPLELKYLPIIESALNPIAVSRAGATGLWQFMLRTGQMYGLEVNSLVDERRDPVKASDAAARYLKDLYDIYGDWNLVIAAYNCGPGNVNKAIKRSGGAKDYWAIYSFLPKETKGYVPAFIAATYVMNFYSEHNICPMEYVYPVSVDTVMVNQMLHFQQIANVLNIPMDEIRSLNPQYKKDFIPGSYKGYELCLPSKSISEFIMNQDTIFAYNVQSLLAHRKTVEIEGADLSSGKVTRTHKIKRGETLGAISQKYGVSVAQLKKLNNLKSTRGIMAGKTLVISRAAVVKKSVDAVKPETQQLAANTTTAPQVAEKQQAVDTATTLERDTTLIANNLSGFFDNQSKSTATGQIDDKASAENNASDTLSLAAAEDEDAMDDRERLEDNRTIYHKVKIGETLPLIARKYDVKAADIVAWNKLTSKKLKIGQRLMLILPEKAETPASELVVEATVSNIQFAEKESVKPVVAESGKPQAPKANKLVYRVKRGDSLSVIAKKYGKVTPEAIMLANNLKNDKLSIGQKLNIPLN